MYSGDSPEETLVDDTVMLLSVDPKILYYAGPYASPHAVGPPPGNPQPAGWVAHAHVHECVGLPPNQQGGDGMNGPFLAIPWQDTSPMWNCGWTKAFVVWSGLV